MPVGYVYMEFYLSWSHSLKEKRKFLNSFKGKIHSRYNVAISELKYQDLWQRSGIGIVTIAPEKEYIEGIFERLRKEVEKLDAELIKEEVEFL